MGSDPASTWTKFVRWRFTTAGGSREVLTIIGGSVVFPVGVVITGQSTDLDPEVAHRGLAFMSGALTPENRGDFYRPEVPVPNDAPPYDRIAAFAGRDPS